MQRAQVFSQHSYKELQEQGCGAFEEATEGRLLAVSIQVRRVFTCEWHVMHAFEGARKQKLMQQHKQEEEEEEEEEEDEEEEEEDFF